VIGILADENHQKHCRLETIVLKLATNSKNKKEMSMRNLFVILICLLISTGATADRPQDALDEYFNVLTSRNYDSLGSIMDSGDMAELQVLMVNAIRQQARRGRYDLQKRIYGKKVTMKPVRETSADFFIGELSREILTAAETQHLVVTGQEILGRVDENEEMVHFLARVYMTQGETTARNIRIYTMVKEGDTWKMKFPDVIKQMLQIIEVSVNQQFGS
jgi:hypothetical protein